MSEMGANLTIEDAPPVRPPRVILEETGIEAICDMIMDGMMLREISRDLGIKGHASLIKWINDDEARAKAVKEARKLAAYACDEAALAAIRAATSKLELAIAREEASHQRWRASKMNPIFGDKLALGGDDGPLTVVIKRLTDGN